MQNLDEENSLGCNSSGKYGVPDIYPYETYKNYISSLEQWNRDIREMERIDPFRFRKKLLEIMVITCYKAKYNGEYDEEKARSEFLGITDDPHKIIMNTFKAIVDQACAEILNLIQGERNG